MINTGVSPPCSLTQLGSAYNIWHSDYSCSGLHTCYLEDVPRDPLLRSFHTQASRGSSCYYFGDAGLMATWILTGYHQSTSRVSTSPLTTCPYPTQHLRLNGKWSQVPIVGVESEFPLFSSFSSPPPSALVRVPF